MTHYFIQWPKTEDRAFRTFYKENTGETIQDYPIEHLSGETFLIGTNRVSDKQLKLLTDKFPAITATKEFPIVWASKEEPDLI